MVNKYEMWKCPKCGEELLAPTYTDYRGFNEFKITEYIHKCERDLTTLSDDYQVYPHMDFPILAFRWRDSDDNK